jgi:hypothetical protein
MKIKRLNDPYDEEKWDEVQNNFPPRLIDLFTTLNYEGGDGVYVGRAMNIRSDVKTIKFSIQDEYLICTHENRELFKIIKNVNVGTLLVIMQYFGIIHHRFIYERIDGIVDDFRENYEN